MLGGPGWSDEISGFPQNNVGGSVGGNKGCVAGILECRSLTRRYVLSRQALRVQTNTDMVRALMPEGPPLLKERRYLRKGAAEQMWKSLQTQGWKKTRPLRGATAEP